MSTVPVLVVDCDGTLVKTDTLWESIALMLRRYPLCSLLIPLWVFRGKAFFKKRIADHVLPDPRMLPYNEHVLSLCEERKRAGSQVWLATASDQRIAQAIAGHVGLFSGVIASDGQRNMRGKHKVAAIREQLGPTEFDYAGNGKEDIPVWQAAVNAYVVSDNPHIAKMTRKPQHTIQTLPVPAQRLSRMVAAMRPHQWIKNTLLFVPLFLSHASIDSRNLRTLAVAFLSFSLGASAVYILNDILDIESDRLHNDKRKRPFAAGQISIPRGFLMVLACVSASCALSMYGVSFLFTIIVLCYVATALCYSLKLKRLLLIDVLGLSAFYTIRLFSGGVAASVEITPWFLGFSSFFFLGLAYVKRYVELRDYSLSPQETLKGRAYRADDIPVVLSAGLASGYMSVLVFCLYITSSPVVKTLYSQPEFLWFVAPLLTYWISRLWILARRKQVDSDPVVFAARDPVSWLTGAAVVAVVLVSA